ncbi:MAG: hypothetical protein HWN80_07950 [Candidatus Lokiarchaeota archaeon]|nr:hypothetical protein [Candidatus Lokiarchaeota archaeon]
MHLVSISIGLNLIPPEYVYVFIPLLPGPMLTDVILLYLFPVIIYFLIDLISPTLVQFLYKVNKLSYVFRKVPNYGFLAVGDKFKPSRIFLGLF